MSYCKLHFGPQTQFISASILSSYNNSSMSILGRLGAEDGGNITCTVGPHIGHAKATEFMRGFVSFRLI